MESFYGGRSGAAFIIVKHFDGIDIPQPDKNGNYAFTGGYYAVDNNKKLILSGGAPIAREASNQNAYSWEYFLHDSNIVVTTSNGGTYSFADKLAEGMVQCFEQGAASSSEVNYGEYVIIDTIINLHNKNDDDNGKVFRRGMDYQADLAGAEYIGQIVGPQGETPEIDITHYLDIVAMSPHKQDTYNPVQQDIIPGSYIDASGTRQFEDEIKFAYATMKDAAGNIIGCQIGFQIPTLINEFEANSIDPYTNRIPGTSGFSSKYTDLIVEDPTEWDGQNWKHPFYEKWQISIPQGYHGVNSTNIEIIPSFTRPAYVTATENYPGAVIYSDPSLTNPIATSAAELELLRDELYDADDSVPYAIVEYDGVQCYVKKEDCYKEIVRYRETNFDNIAAGEVTYFEIGDYNSVQKITLSENGILTVFYTSTDPKALEKAVRWIDNQDTHGIEIDADGTMHVYYNTTHTPDSSDPFEVLNPRTGAAHDHSDYATVLDWIEEVTLSQDGKFRVLYNNKSVTSDIDPVTGKSQYRNTLNWIDYITVTDDGIVNFYYNTDHTSPIYSSSTTNRIKYIKDIKFNSTDGTPGALEGSGDQKFVVTYNTRDAFGNNEVENNSSWAAMNYIIEAKISTPSVQFPHAPFCHLIVIYSDPAYRAARRSQWVSYPSDKLGVVYNEWVDLGNVRGEKGGLHSVTNVTDLSDLYDDSGSTPPVPIPPEYLLTADRTRKTGNPYIWVDGVDADYTYAGWGATIQDLSTGTETIYFYDYANKKWYSVGTIDTSLISPNTIISKSVPNSKMEPSPADDTLHDDGFWLAAETAIYVN